jgi:hypothetical protein
MPTTLITVWPARLARSLDFIDLVEMMVEADLKLLCNGNL